MYLARKVLIEDAIFTSSSGDAWHRHFTWSSEQHQVLAVCRAKEELSFVSCFETITIEICSQGLYRVS